MIREQVLVILLTSAAWAAVLVVVAFSVRRLLLLAASSLPSRRGSPSRERAVAVLVSARDEATAVAGLLDALEALDYPRDRLSIVLADDGSTDGTAALLAEGCERLRERGVDARAVELPVPVGKPAALMRALEAAPPSELVVVFDADTVPRADSVAWLAGAFDGPGVEVASGYAAPSLPNAGPVARYAAVERWVHQLVLLAGKDRLDWNPPAVGAICAFRRATLIACGGFPRDSLAEDVEVSLRIAGRAGRTRWIREAVASERVAGDLAGFVAQRRRWGVGLARARRSASGWEARLVAAGYVDRIACATALVLAPTEPWLLWPLALFGVAAFGSVCAAIARGGVDRPAAALASLVLVFPVDVAISVATLVGLGVPDRASWMPRRVASERRLISHGPRR